MGIVGLETALPLLYDRLVRTGTISLERLLDAMCFRPRRVFGLDEPGFLLFDPDETYVIDPAQFKSMGRATPFAGWEVRGRVRMTVRNNQIVYRADQAEEVG